MPTLIKFYGDYSNTDVNERLIHYCLDSDYKTYYGGSALIMGNTNTIIKQFKNVQNVYNKANNRPVEHFVISFNDKNSRSHTVIDNDVYYMAKIISCYIGSRFQNVFAVHNGSKDHDDCLHNFVYGPDVNPYNLHVHFIVNRVSYIDGTLFYGNNDNYREIINYAEQNIPIMMNDSLLKGLEWYGPFKQETYFN